MSGAEKDGGPAFPNITPDMCIQGGPGMSLRDWFAGQALASLGDWTPNADDHTPVDWTDMAALRKRRAEWSYAMADAMLAVRGDAP